MKTTAKLIAWAIALGFTSGAFAASHSSTAMPPSASAPMASTTPMAPVAKGHMSPDADNTEMNERDKSGATKTPQDQTDKVPDRKLLAAVRRAVVDDKSLSTKAHNIKIMVKSGAVTLRGPVDSSDETAKVEAIAKGVRGVMKVDNQLDVKTK
jgi:hyperosmotically inducible protein